MWEPFKFEPKCNKCEPNTTGLVTLNFSLAFLFKIKLFHITLKKMQFPALMNSISLFAITFYTPKNSIRNYKNIFQDRCINVSYKFVCYLSILLYFCF